MSEKPICGPRWWPVLGILLLCAGRLVYVWGFAEYQRQYKVIGTAITLAVAIVLLAVWLLFFSRLQQQIRRRVLGVVLVVIVSFAGLFRLRGVTGDLVPIFELRWKKAPQLQSLAEPTRDPGTPSSRPDLFLRDFPQFLGANRNGEVPGVRLAHNWTTNAPKLLWRHPVGAGWSGFAISGRRAVTIEQRDDAEAVTCYDLLTGALAWTHAYPARYDNPVGGVGPRTTPTIAGSRVLSMGSTGILTCLDLNSGELLWKHDLVKEHGGAVPEWGFSSSPLVAGTFVMTSCSGSNRSLVAHRIDTGEFAWGAGTDRPGYSSPQLRVISGVEQIVVFNNGSVAAHAPNDGKLLWEYPWQNDHPNVAMPLIVGNRVMVSTGYGIGAELLEVLRATDRWRVERVWKSIRLKAKFNNPVFKDGFIFGLDDGILACVDAADGSLVWKEGRFGHGQLLLVEDLLLITTEKGQVVMVEASKEHRELASFQALNSKTWNPSALAGQVLLLRNDLEAAAFVLPIENETNSSKAGSSSQPSSRVP